MSTTTAAANEAQPWDTTIPMLLQPRWWHSRKQGLPGSKRRRSRWDLCCYARWFFSGRNCFWFPLGLVGSKNISSIWLRHLVSTKNNDCGRVHSDIVRVIGSIITCASQNIGMLIVGRFINGISVGIASAQVPVYVSFDNNTQFSQKS